MSDKTKEVDLEKEKSPEVIDKKYLAEKHKGLRWSAKGSLRQKAKAVKITLEYMVQHLDIVAERFYSGDIKAVDEFLQLYCFDEKRPKENEVKTMSEKYIVESYVNESKETVYQIRHSTKTVPFIETFDGDFMELVCRLLNENEAKKSLPKIDKQCKEYLLEGIDYQRGRNRFTFEQRQNMTKAIESLECEQ